MKTRVILQRLLAVLCGLLLNSGCMIADNMSGITQTRQLQRTGQPAKATFLRIWDTGTTINNDPVVWLELEVHPEKAAAFQAKTKCLISRLDVPKFQPGCTIPVRYDPADHARVGIDVYQYK